MLLKGSQSNTRARQHCSQERCLLSQAMSCERVSHKTETQKRCEAKKGRRGSRVSDIQVNDSFQGVAHIVFNEINVAFISLK